MLEEIDWIYSIYLAYKFYISNTLYIRYKSPSLSHKWFAAHSWSIIASAHVCSSLICLWPLVWNITHPDDIYTKTQHHRNKFFFRIVFCKHTHSNYIYICGAWHVKYRLWQDYVWFRRKSFTFLSLSIIPIRVHCDDAVRAINVLLPFADAPIIIYTK